ncbi:MAG TPA: NAD(P)H-binding protein [Acidimicrobiia bacterium]|nr:NAD(P)H-binding protein [Acidimicrobiia bacterium]
MPVIVVGADTPLGRRIVDALYEPDREIRAFVSDVGTAEELRTMGVKVALGDVSDASHVSGAALRCFSAVLVTEAASDARERSFARSVDAVLDGWVEAVSEAGVTRVIWVGEGERDVPGTEWVSVDASAEDAAARVVALDDVADL